MVSHPIYLYSAFQLNSILVKTTATKSSFSHSSFGLVLCPLNKTTEENLRISSNYFCNEPPWAKPPISVSREFIEGTNTYTDPLSSLTVTPLIFPYHKLPKRVYLFPSGIHTLINNKKLSTPKRKNWSQKILKNQKVNSFSIAKSWSACETTKRHIIGVYD